MNESYSPPPNPRKKSKTRSDPSSKPNRPNNTNASSELQNSKLDNEDLKNYRDFLVKADHQASLNYDKAVMTLAGGALGISITFLKDIVPYPLPETKILLYISWISLSVSLASILVSYLFSMASLRKAMRQVDDGTIYSKNGGGVFAGITVGLRILATIGFVTGVVGFVWFALANF